MRRIDRAVATIVGSAVGDALGAPFEFGPPGAFSARFPEAGHGGERRRYAAVLADDWHPGRATEFNGAVWPCLWSAVWALRTTNSFKDALRAAIEHLAHRLAADGY